MINELYYLFITSNIFMKGFLILLFIVLIGNALWFLHWVSTIGDE